MRIRQRIMILAVTVIFIYLFLLQIQAIWPFTIDDMYITLRYADHWAQGLGLVWNAGELPVEGYSNFSFVLLGRLAISLGINPVYFLKCLGVVGLFFTCTAVYRLSRFWFLPRIAVIPVIWLLAYSGEIIWSVSGLETTVYQALVAYSVVFLLKGLGYCPFSQPAIKDTCVDGAEKRNSRLRQKKNHTYLQSMALAGIFLAFAGFTRPEAPVLMAVFMGLAWFSSSLGKPDSNAGFGLFVALFMVCFVPYFLWRWHYFGRLFPNPIYCKGLTGALDLTLIKQYLNLAWPFMALAVPAICTRHDKRHYFLWLPSVVYGFLLMGASPVVAFDNRLFLPAFVLLLPLSLQGIQVIWVKFLKQRDDVSDVVIWGVSCLLLFFCIPKMPLSGYRHFAQNPQAGEALRLRVIHWLDENTPPTSRVVLADCGLIPYLSPHRFIDSYCLNNAEMTQDLGRGMYTRFCNHMMVIKPDVIILTALIHGKQTTYPPADQCMALQLKKQSRYLLKARFSTGTHGDFYRYEIFGLMTK